MELKITRRNKDGKRYLTNVTTGDKYVFEPNWVASTLKKNGSPHLVQDGFNRVYSDGRRAWDEDAQTWFYPDCDADELAEWNAVISVINDDR